VTVDVLLRFPLSSLPSFLHRRRGRSLFWVQWSSFPSPSVVQVVVPAIPLSCFFLVCRSDAAGSVSPPCRKFDVIVVLLAGGVSRALLRTTGSAVSCLLCFVCRGCVVAGLGGRWRRCRTAFPSNFSWWWSAGFSVLGCRWYILVEIC